MKYKVKNIEKQNDYQKQDYSTLKQTYTLYINYLKKLKESEIMSGSVSEQFGYFIEYASKLTEITDEIQKCISKDLNAFLKEVDEDQTYKGQKIIYQSSYPGMRDFTDKKLKDLKYLCESNNYDSNFVNTFLNGIENLGYRLSDWFDSNIKEKFFNVKKSTKKFQERMFQLNDVTQKILENIFTNANQTDENYAKNLNCSLKLIQKLDSCLEELIIIMDNGSSNVSNFSIEPYYLKLSKLFTDLEQQLTEVNNIYIITDEDLEILIKEYNQDFLQKQIDDLEAYISDLGSLGEALVVILYTLDDAAKASLGFDDYEDVLYEEDILNYIAAVVEDDSNEFEVEEGYISDFETFLKYIEKCGGKADDITAYLAGLDKKESKYFTEVIDSLGIGNALEILKCGQYAIDWLVELFKNYGEHLKVLDTIEKYCKSDYFSEKAFKDIRDKYTKETNKIISDIVKKVIAEGIDQMVSFVKPIDIVKKIHGYIEVIFSDQEESAKAKYALNWYGNRITEYKESLSKAINKLSKCKKGTKEWEECAKDVKNMFAFFKTSLSDSYNKMSMAVTGNKKAYYNYVASLINKITIKNFNSVKIPTYKQYLSM